MKFSITALLLTVAITVYSQSTGPSISIIQPVSGAVWYAGATHDITWSFSGSSVTNIESTTLFKGSSATLEVVLTITSNPFPASDLKYTWFIPANLADDSSYVIRVTTTSGNSVYSPYFAVMGVIPPDTLDFPIFTTTDFVPAPPVTTTRVPIAGSTADSTSAVSGYTLAGPGSTPAVFGHGSGSNNPLSDAGVASGVKVSTALGAAAMAVAGAVMI